MKHHVFAFSLAVCTRLAAGLELTFEVPKGGARCFGDELSKGELMIATFSTAGDYTFDFAILNGVSEADNPEEKAIRVTSTGGNAVVFESGKKIAKTSVVANVSGPYWACLLRPVAGPAAAGSPVVTLAVKSGSEAHDFSQVADATTVRKIEDTLNRMKADLASYKESVAFMKVRDEKLKEMHESTGSMIIFGVVVQALLIVACQFIMSFFLKRYFRNKKII